MGTAALIAGAAALTGISLPSSGLEPEPDSRESSFSVARQLQMPESSFFSGIGQIILEGLCLLYAEVFQGHRPSCRVELCRTRLNFAARPSGYGTNLFIYFCILASRCRNVSPALARVPLLICSCPDPAHIPQQMLRARRVDESLREQLKTKSDIHPLSLCGEVVAPTKSSQRISSLISE